MLEALEGMMTNLIRRNAMGETINPSIEIWKPVVGYEGIYEVSSLGRVKKTAYIMYSIRNKASPRAERILKQKYFKGYKRVSLRKDGSNKTAFVHRLIAMAFIPNPERKPCIDHINTIRDDNRIENLRWCTTRENNNNEITKQKHRECKMPKGKDSPNFGKKHSLATREKISLALRKKPPMKGKHHTEETKRRLSEYNKGKIAPNRRKIQNITTGEVFDSVLLAGKAIGVKNAYSITLAIKRNYACKGFYWRYADGKPIPNRKCVIKPRLEESQEKKTH